MIMTDRELLESLIEKVNTNQSQTNNIEIKMDQFAKEYKEMLYEYGQNCGKLAKPSCWW